MPKNKDSALDALTSNIRRQIRTEENARFLRRIPLFAVEKSLPNELLDLLKALDAEDRPR